VALARSSTCLMVSRRPISVARVTSSSDSDARAISVNITATRRPIEVLLHSASASGSVLRHPRSAADAVTPRNLRRMS